MSLFVYQSMLPTILDCSFSCLFEKKRFTSPFYNYVYDNLLCSFLNLYPHNIMLPDVRDFAQEASSTQNYVLLSIHH